MWTNRRLLYDKPAQLPTPFWIGTDLAVFYSHRVDGRSHIGRLMFDRNLKLLDNNPEILTPGRLGCFDQDGVMPSQVFHGPAGYVMYYSGWYRKDKGYYGHAISMAVSKDGCTFERQSDGPLLSLGPEVPYLANSGVVVDNHLYFCNGTGWDGLFPMYRICRAVWCENHWMGARPIVGELNQAVSRPCIHAWPGKPQSLWAAYRTKWEKYKIGYWEDFELIDQDVLPLRPGEFDSEQTAYPWVFNHNDTLMMVYNGNGYGETGIGIAEQA